MLRRDLKAAGIPYKDADGLVADFHSLRASYATNLIKSGATVKTAQALLRHSTPTLTIGTSCKLDVHDINGAVERLPDLAPEDDSTRESMAATGADGDHISGRFATHLPLTGAGNGRDVSDLGGISPSTPEALASPAMSRNPLETGGLDASCRDLSLAGGTEGVGFEPTDVSRRQRFSRPSRSTTLAPLLDSDNAMPRVRLLADLVDDIFGHEDRDVDRHGDGDGVARPGVDLDQLAVVPDPELGVVGVVA